MKQTKQELPPGWTEKKIRAVIEHYDAQSEDESAAEIANAPFAPGETWISVPTELLGSIHRLIDRRTKKRSTTAKNRKEKAATKLAGRKSRSPKS